MGSDSRTATASSKSRPSWRDRHLSQLSDEQLDEVNQHRGSDSVSESAGIGVDSNSPVKADRSNAASNNAAAGATNPGLPRQPAGMTRENRSHPDSQDHNRQGSGYKGSNGKGSGNRSDDNRHRSSARDNSSRDPLIDPATDPRANYKAEESRNSGAAGYSARDAENYEHRNDARSGDARSNDTDRNEASRNDAGRRRPGRYESYERTQSRDSRRQDTLQYDTRQDYESDDRAPRIDDSAEVQSESKKGFVNKVLDFKLPPLVKYSLMAVAVAVMVAVSLLKPIDSSSQTQLDSAFSRAMIGFGLAKALNGVISVAQGTEFAVQPAGVGVNFSPGEILDPVNDLVEQFSTIMLLATSAIGIQQILLQISSWAGISVLLAGAGLFFLLTRLRNSAIARLADFAGKLLLAMILVRFLIPVGALANDWVYKQFLQPQYEESSAQLEVASERIKEISTRQAEVAENDGSLTDRAKQFYSSMTSKFDFDGMLDDYKESADAVSENAINLIVVFVLQTIIFPLLFMYLLYRLFRFVVIPPRHPR